MPREARQAPAADPGRAASAGAGRQADAADPVRSIAPDGGIGLAQLRPGESRKLLLWRQRRALAGMVTKWTLPRVPTVKPKL